DEMISNHHVAHGFAHHSARDPGDLETNLGKSPTKQTVHLIAPAAAAPTDDLFEDGRTLDRDRTPKLHIEILVRNGEKMRAMQSAQAFEVGTHRRIEPNAATIVFNAHNHTR